MKDGVFLIIVWLFFLWNYFRNGLAVQIGESGHSPQLPGIYLPSDVNLVAHHSLPAFRKSVQLSNLISFENHRMKLAGT